MKLRLGTFNLFQFIAPPFCYYEKSDKISPVEWEAKTAWIEQQLVKMNCDIIGFQEVFSPLELEKLVKKIGFNYFEVIDTPKTKSYDDTIYTSTLVAIASKYPIKKLQEVKLFVPSLKQHNFEGHFKFSRKPIKATIELPSGKEILCYVCHFKSNKENEFEYVFKQEHSLEHKKEQVKKALEGNFSMSLKQRLCETSSLFHDIKKEKNIPKVLMCDLNDKEYSLSIEAMFNKAYHYNHTSEKKLLDDPYYFYKPKIYNPHPEQKKSERTPTSYYQSVGNVLDYVFVSKEFLKEKVHSYEVLNEHLQKHKDGSIRTSDHAQVVCEVSLK